MSTTSKSAAEDRAALRRTLRRVFGLRELRPGQEEVIRAVLANEDALAIMPTGAGKSLCYQLPALHQAGSTIVVSPLIALMKDQADSLAEAGVAVAQVNSAFSDSECAQAMEDVAQGRVKIAFFTPERLCEPATLRALAGSTVARVVIDEAHCICQWGHDFRPAYLELPAALAELGNPPVLALTATATDAMEREIEQALARPRMRVIQTAMYRPNLRYGVTHVSSDDQRVAKVMELVQSLAGSGIVYTATLACLEEVHEALVRAGVTTRCYHGKLGTRERTESQDAFMRGDVRVMVATHAFGLGVDKPDIRFVLHAQMPGTLEAYYQESGRAGRDGAAARCILLYDLRDRRTQQFFLVRRYPDEAQITAVQDALVRAAPGGTRSIADLHAELPQVATGKLKVASRLLATRGVAERTRRGEWRLAGKPLPPAQIALLAKIYVAREEQDREKLERMVFYGQTGQCRWRVLLDYFGEGLPDDRCGTCDNCRRAAQREVDAAIADFVTPVPRGRAFASGDAVRVPRFGIGVVRGALGNEVTVELEDGSTRTFLATYLRRERLRLPAAAGIRPDPSRGGAATAPAD